MEKEEKERKKQFGTLFNYLKISNVIVILSKLGRFFFRQVMHIKNVYVIYHIMCPS